MYLGYLKNLVVAYDIIESLVSRSRATRSEFRERHRNARTRHSERVIRIVAFLSLQEVLRSSEPARRLA